MTITEAMNYVTHWLDDEKTVFSPENREALQTLLDACERQNGNGILAARERAKLVGLKQLARQDQKDNEDSLRAKLFSISLLADA